MDLSAKADSSTVTKAATDKINVENIPVLKDELIIPTADMESEDYAESSDDDCENCGIRKPENLKRKQEIFEGLETEDTKILNLQELQRMVLLKQLRMFAKQEKFQKKLEMVADLQIRRLRTDDDGDFF